MPFEFEALVGHLNIVGGRSISAPPPGALVEVAPKKAARGREADTFFTIVLPSGDVVPPATFYEKMAQLAAERYFNSTGSVTSGLREVFHSLNQDLVEHNQSARRPYEANIICAVLRGRDLILGRIGGCVALVHQNGRTQSFPEDLTDDEALYTAPMGVHPVPNVKMAQYRVSSGTRVVFGDANLADLERDGINKALKVSELGSVLVEFKALARLQMALMSVEFVPPDIPTPASIPAAQSTVEITTQGRVKSSTEVVATASEVETETAPDSAPRKSARDKDKDTPPPEIERRARYGLGRLALLLAGGLGIITRIFERFFGGEDAETPRWLSTPMGAGMTVLLPVVVVALVVFLWLTRTGESGFELCVQEAESRVSLAQSFSTGQRQMVMDAWERVLDKVDECREMRPEDARMAEIRREGQGVLDVLNRIQRREVTRIDSLPGATLTRIVARGQDLYVLDSANGWVYQITLSEDGLSATRPGSVIPGMRRGGTASGFPIGEIIDITFNEDDNVIVAVDRAGILIECSPRFLQCEGQRLLGAENWGEPVAITTWQRRIYVLDPGVGDGQVWRYERAGGSYSNPPGEYFTGNRPALRSAVDIAIDGSGHVYTLLADGIIQRWFGGVPQPFNFADFPEGQELNSAASMYLDDRVISQSIYIVNQNRRTIYESSWSGTFFNSYSIFEEELFDSIQSVVVAPGQAGQELIYAVSGNTVFAFQKG